jgi:hypothetical protein
MAKDAGAVKAAAPRHRLVFADFETETSPGGQPRETFRRAAGVT